MLLVEKITQIKEFLKKKGDKKIAFVPTMGALHEGHLALIKKAKELGEIVVVSIFVNKAQFNDAKDYEKYPRQLEEDLQKIQNLKMVDYIFAPSFEEMLKIESEEFIIDDNLKNCLCGKARKGHFEGVLEIISKFFQIIKPDFAIFGQKDFQQFLIIKDFAKKYHENVQIIPFEIVRQESGLAMSSRNQRLSNNEQILSANIYKILSKIRQEILETKEEISQILARNFQDLMAIGFEKIDYLEVRRQNDLKLVTTNLDQESARIFIALYLSGVRLIDNLKI